MKKTILAAALAALASPVSGLGVDYLERERFGVRSHQGPRSATGLPLGINSDTGYNNSPSANPIGQRMLGFLDPTVWMTDCEDFLNRYATADWTITKVGTGAGALTAGSGGLLAVTNSAAGADLTSHQRTVVNMALSATKPFYFSARFQVDNAANADVIVGLMRATATPFTDTSEEIIFKKAAAATVDFKFGNASAFTTSAAAFTMVDATNVNVEMGYDGVSVFYSVNGVVSGPLSSANLPVANAMTPTFAVRNNTAVARILTLDYFLAAVGR